MDQNNQELLQEKRKARRRRRVRNQIFAYILVFIFIAAIAVGIVFGVQYLTQESKKNEQEKQQAQVDQLIGEEGDISVPETETEPEKEIVELTPEQKLDEIVNAGIEVMPIEDKVAGLFIVTPESITGVSSAIKAGDGTKDALTKYSVGGIIYGSKNIQSEAQIKEMIDTTKLYANYPLFIAIEEEGGKVSPLQEKKLVDKTEDAPTIGASGNVNKAQEAGKAIGTYLNAYGFNLDLAPVADINSVEHSVVEKRAYDKEASAVGAYAAAMVQGLQEQKVAACLKHFPGLGSTTQDPDAGLSTTDRSLDDFKENEFVAFKTGIDAGADMVMVSHMAAPALSGDNTPCSMSSAVVTDLLRKELGFDGVIITDAMNISAISEYYGSDEAAVMALRAGCDMILMPEDFEKAYNGVLEAVKSGVISEERINDSLRRVYRIKYADRVAE